MRVLKFIVDKQILKKDPECDFDNIVPGTEGYLQAEFSFSSDWNNTARVVIFYYNKHTKNSEYTHVILKDGKTCMIPTEVLKYISFDVQVVGKGDNLKLVSTKELVRQDGGM